jgi:hypothetical protein
MQVGTFKFGSIQLESVTYEYDVVIDRGRIRKRKKKPSKPFRSSYGHTPLSAPEDIPWQCRRLVVGTGAHGAPPIMEEVEREAQARKVELVKVSDSAGNRRVGQGRQRYERHSARDLLKGGAKGEAWVAKGEAPNGPVIVRRGL